MTIDEIIAAERDNAEFSKANKYDKSADYHNQIAELLEELKAYRENSNGYNKEDIELNRNAMYNKAIDNFVEHIRTYYTLKQEMGYVATTYKDLINYIFELAEQLKAGGIDETI